MKWEQEIRGGEGCRGWKKRGGGVGVNTEIWSNPISYSWRYTPPKTFLLRAEVTGRNEGNTVGNHPYYILFGKRASPNKLTTPKWVYAYSMMAINSLSQMFMLILLQKVKQFAQGETNWLPAQCYRKSGPQSHYMQYYFALQCEPPPVQFNQIRFHQVTSWVLLFLHKKRIKVAILHSSLCLMDCCKTRPFQRN